MKEIKDWNKQVKSMGLKYKIVNRRFNLFLKIYLILTLLAFGITIFLLIKYGVLDNLDFLKDLLGQYLERAREGGL